MSRFVKPNNDRILYLFSDAADKLSIGTRTSEYRWNIPDINLNDYGKLSLINRQFSIFSTAWDSPIVTRIMNVGSKDTIDTSKGAGEILDVSYWNSELIENPPIVLQPQTINSITLSVNDDWTLPNSGCETDNRFLIVLKLTEKDRDNVYFGDLNNINVNQREVPKY